MSSNFPPELAVVRHRELLAERAVDRERAVIRRFRRAARLNRRAASMNERAAALARSAR